MAAARSDAQTTAGRGDGAACVLGSAGSVVAVHDRHRGAGHRVGAAAPPGPSVMGLWTQIARFFGGGAADSARLETVQRLLLEADFGVAATNETVERLSRAPHVDQATLERIVVEQLGPAAAPLARAEQ